MSDDHASFSYPPASPAPRTNWKTILFQILLFSLTLISTTFAGAEWIYADSFFNLVESDTFLSVAIVQGNLGWSHWLDGLYYSVPFLGILTFHEFGHYFAALHYRLRVSLPYYIPIWLGFLGMPSTIGTMGAFIKIKSPLKTRAAFFDVGIAGPLAGFVVALGVLIYGFQTFPPQSYLIEKPHPQWQAFYEQHGNTKFVYAAQEDFVKRGYSLSGQIELGTNLLFEFCKQFLINDPTNLPPNSELMHYPWILAGYLALFFTALNLMPIGQLDGGHVLYGLLGSKRHGAISRIIFVVFIGYAGLGLFSIQDNYQDLLLYGALYLFFLYATLERSFESRLTALVIATAIFTTQFVLKTVFPTVEGYQGWLLFGFIIGRFLGTAHPEALDEKTPLSPFRKFLGWLALIVFILCFSPTPFVIS
ncbi:site-2 protease family protein [Hugenholtzia roseola]|uniref:site-2 protease family protein n=1 Tax=Hugenholtzia roseola TaxID=1002 RepID=UPI000413D8D5|nr:site-2 protease family protein [Hugenholtzia roseola]